MDGLLIDSEPIWRRAWRDAFWMYWVAPEDYVIDAAKVQWVKHKDVTRMLTKQFGIDVSLSDEIADIKVNNVIKYIRESIEFMPWALMTLKKVQESGLPTALASGSPHEVIDVVMDVLNIGKYFHARISGSDVTHGKPSPEIFEFAAKSLDLSSDYCLVFEDAPNGIVAAKAAGMKVLTVPSSYCKWNPTFSEADIQLTSLEEFTPDHLNIA